MCLSLEKGLLVPGNQLHVLKTCAHLVNGENGVCLQCDGQV